MAGCGGGAIGDGRGHVLGGRATGEGDHTIKNMLKL